MDNKFNNYFNNKKKLHLKIKKFILNQLNKFFKKNNNIKKNNKIDTIKKKRAVIHQHYLKKIALDKRNKLIFKKVMPTTRKHYFTKLGGNILFFIIYFLKKIKYINSSVNISKNNKIVNYSMQPRVTIDYIN
jgi:hypothetical protein